MPRLHYRIVNVFTRAQERFTGNSLCVFEDGSELDTETMQALARQFNLSETTFLLPSSRADARVRIFTPTFEMPFAGHPTLGSAHVVRLLRSLGSALTLEMDAGIIPVAASGAAYTLKANAPTFREFSGSKSALAEALGLSERDIGERPLWVNAGKEQLIVPITREAAVREIESKHEALAGFRSLDGDCMVYVFATLPRGRVLARFFFEVGQSLLEDPATGSAAANLGGFMLATGRALPIALEIEQGEYTGRPSNLRVAVSEGREIYVTGEVLELGGGSLEL